MHRVSLLMCAVILAALLIPHPIAAQDTPICDIKSLFDQAAKLKSTGDQAKDYAALVEYAKAITAQSSACKAIEKPYPKTNDDGNFKSPIGLGEQKEVKNDTQVAIFIITKALRGKDAIKFVMSVKNAYIEPAPQGMEPLLIYVQLDYIKGSESEPWDVYPSGLLKIRSKGQLIEPKVTTLKPEFRSKIFPSAHLEGWVLFHVDIDDPSPLVLFGSEYDGSGGLYFATTPN